MANVQFTKLSGGDGVFRDAAFIDPNAGIVSLTADQLRIYGVTRGTRITSSAVGVDPVDVQESVEAAKTIVRAAAPSLATNIVRDGMPAATEVFNAAGPTIVTGLRCTIPAGGGGTYMFQMAGVLQSSDAANAGASVQLAKNGAPVGTALQWGPAQFVGNALKALGAGGLGPQFTDVAVPGDFYEILIGVNPGGVAGDDITLTDATLTAIRIS
jgi:hypothetical protein